MNPAIFSRLAFLFTALLFVGLALPAHAFDLENPGPPRLSQAQVSQILGGNPFTSVEAQGNNNRAEMVTIIPASVERVWTVIAAYEAYPTWFPDQRRARVVQSSGDTRRLYGETRVPIIRNRRYEMDDWTERRNVNGQTHIVNTFTYVQGSGNVEETSGFWYVMPYSADPSKTLVRFVLYADLGLPIPQFLIAWGTENILPKIARGIASEATSG